MVLPRGRWPMKRSSAVLLFFLLVFPAFCQGKPQSDENPLFLEASHLYQLQQYDAAIAKFEEALKADPSDERIYLYLGVAYQQKKKFPQAIDIFQRGLLVAKDHRAEMLNNIGNCYNKDGLADYTAAEKYYNLAIAENKLFPYPYLNRAGIRINQKRYSENQASIEDCQTYLRLYPQTPKRKEVEALIAALQKDVADQAKLLDDILNSLKNASADTHTDSAGTEGFKDTGKDGGDILD